MGHCASAVPHASAAWILSGLLLLLALPEGSRSAPACSGPHGWWREVPDDRVTGRVCASASVPARVLGREAEGILFGEPLDPNLASARALEALPGIGPRRASALVSARAEVRFLDTADLVRVPGIGPRTLERVRPFVRVTDPQDILGSDELRR